MEILAILLSPIILAMSGALEIFRAATGSYGLAIVLLSVAVRIASIPVSRLGKKYEDRERNVQHRMAPALARARSESSGRGRFERTEEIYAEHGYHPIHSLASLLPLAVQIPFLLSALVLLVGNSSLAGQSFLFIEDLARPDAFLSIRHNGAELAVNILPLALTAVAIIESRIRDDTRSARLRFLIMSLILVVLIYPLAAAVCLYWLSSNVWSLSVSLMRARAMVAVAHP